MHKNKPRTQSPQLNKKAVLGTTEYFKVSNLVRSQRQLQAIHVVSVSVGTEAAVRKCFA